MAPWRMWIEGGSDEELTPLWLAWTESVATAPTLYERTAVDNPLPLDVAPDGKTLWGYSPIDSSAEYLDVQAGALTPVVIPSTSDSTTPLVFASPNAWYVTPEQGVMAINIDTRAVVGSTPIVADLGIIVAMAATPDNTKLVVVWFDQNDTLFKVSVVDTATVTVVGGPVTVPTLDPLGPVGNPSLQISPDSSTAYITDFEQNTSDPGGTEVHQFSLSSYTFTGACTVAVAIESALTADGSYVVVSYYDDAAYGQAYIVETSTMTVTGTVSVPGIFVGALVLAANPVDASKVYGIQSNATTDTNIVIIDAATATITASDFAGVDTSQLLVTPDGEGVFVTGSDSTPGDYLWAWDGDLTPVGVYNEDSYGGASMSVGPPPTVGWVVGSMPLSGSGSWFPAVVP